jgi:hypothetical protein
LFEDILILKQTGLGVLVRYGVGVYGLHRLQVVSVQQHRSINFIHILLCYKLFQVHLGFGGQDLVNYRRIPLVEEVRSHYGGLGLLWFKNYWQLAAAVYSTPQACGVTVELPAHTHGELPFMVVS